MVLRSLLAALALALAAATPVSPATPVAPVAFHRTEQGRTEQGRTEQRWAEQRWAEQRRAEPGDVKWYRVRPSFDGEEEYLYEIAERFLGDGDRHDEIFQLNKGRVQADGESLTVPDEIESGWVLQLPDDATGPGVEVGPLPTAPPSVSAAPLASPPAVGAAPEAAADEDSGLLLPLLGGGILVLAGGALLAFLLVRRRRVPPPTPPAFIPRQRTGPPPLRPLDPAAAWTVDRALRVLVTSAEAAGRPVPPVLGVTIDDSWVSLRLSAPDEQPFAPWEARSQGRVWIAPLRGLQALPADPATGTPCPRLVTLGTAAGTRELLDLGRAPGPIAVRGDTTAARALLAAWAVELTNSPWSAGVRVVAGGLRPEIEDEPRVVSAETPAAALAEILGPAPDPVAEPDDTEPGTAEPDTAEPGLADGWLGVLILSALPDRLPELPDGWTVVVLGRARQDGWQITVGPDGTVDTGRLGISIHAAP
ncbi:hypothetical protein [Actinoplanes friuliensis]|nr:hypothetical protein [Actinoplanes friuliensis]